MSEAEVGEADNAVDELGLKETEAVWMESSSCAMRVVGLEEEKWPLTLNSRPSS